LADGPGVGNTRAGAPLVAKEAEIGGEITMSAVDNFADCKDLPEIYEVERTVIALHNHRHYRIEVRRSCKKAGDENLYSTTTYVESKSLGTEANTPPWAGEVWQRFGTSDSDRHDADGALRQALLNLSKP
jgi:hypothetical protein